MKKVKQISGSIHNERLLEEFRVLFSNLDKTTIKYHAIQDVNKYIKGK